MQPKISVIITVFNLENRLASLLESLEAQTFQDFEAIFIDDASSDKSATILNDFAIKQHKFNVQIVVNESNIGQTASQNKGLEISTGGYICFLDGDDIIDKKYLEKLYSAIDTADIEIAICGYKTLEITTGKEELFPMVLDKTPNEILIGRMLNKIPLCQCSILFKRSFFERTGLRYSDSCSAGGDVEFILKVMCCAERVAFIPDCLYIYVQHPQMSMQAHKKNPAVMIERYNHNTGAHMRTAQYLLAYAKDDSVKALAKHLLLPAAYLRQLSVYAMQRKPDNFKQLLDDKEVRSCLWQSYRSFFTKSEVFGRALLVLLLPKIYYISYANKYR